MPVQIQLRHDTAANWTSVHPTLALGEVGVETDTGKLKVGDGATAWPSLPYAPGGGAGGTPAVVLGTTAAAGAASTFIRDDDTIVAFDTTAPAGVGASAATGSVAKAARRDHVHPGLGAPLALTGATAATRYVGATTSGAPASGTFAVGDYVVAQNGHVWVCTGAGTSGTWVDAGAGGGLVDEGAFTYLDATDAAAPGNPSAGYHRLYSKSGGLYYRDSGGTEVGPLGSGGGGGSDVVNVASGAGSVTIPGLKGSPDAQPASPNAKDDEFEAFSGWTVLGTLDVSNVTDFPSHWHVERAVSSEIDGIYKAIPSMPFTVTAGFKIMDLTANFTNTTHPSVGIMLLDATPTAVRDFCLNQAGGGLNSSLRRYTNRTAFASSADVALAGFFPLQSYMRNMFLRLAVASASSCTFSYSFDGYLWYTPSALTAIDPTITPAFVGLSVSDPVSGTPTVRAVVDWVRFS